MVAASRANPNASPSVPGTELRTSRHCGTALHPPSRRGTPSRGTSSSQTTIPRWRLTTTMVRKQRSVLELATFPALPRPHASAQRQHRSQDRATTSTKATSSSTARQDSRLTWARTTCALSATITRTWMKPVSREILRRSGSHSLHNLSDRLARRGGLALDRRRVRQQFCDPRRWNPLRSPRRRLHVRLWSDRPSWSRQHQWCLPRPNLRSSGPIPRLGVVSRQYSVYESSGHERAVHQHVRHCRLRSRVPAERMGASRPRPRDDRPAAAE